MIYKNSEGHTKWNLLKTINQMLLELINLLRNKIKLFKRAHALIRHMIQSLMRHKLIEKVRKL
jgi:hypothetical protein